MPPPRHRSDRLLILFYNVLSLVQAARSDEISSVYGKAHVLMLAGTRLQRKRHDTECTVTVNHAHMVFNWGYAAGAFTNKSAGVQIRVRADLFRAQHIRRLWATKPCIQGRAGAVRLVSGRFDLTCIVAYFPPFPNEVDKQAVYHKTIHVLLEWLKEVLK